MRNNAKRVLALAVVFLLCMGLCAFGAESETFTLRIEGCFDTVFGGEVPVPEDGILWTAVKQVLDENSIPYEVSQGEGYVFINSINNEASGMIGWLDGWQYTVNSVAPSDYVNNYTVRGGDEVVLYYGDMIDTMEGIVSVSPKAPAQGDDLTITVMGKRGVLDASWNVVDYEYLPMEGALVTFDSKVYTADENGSVTISDISGGKHSYSVRKDNENSYPSLIRTGETELNCGIVTCASASEGVNVSIAPNDAGEVSIIYTVTENGAVKSCTEKKADITSGYSETVPLKEGQTLYVNVLTGKDLSSLKIGMPLGRAVFVN